MLSKKVDYVIVGQGLAGSVLAHQLIIRDKKIMIIDNNHVGSSSKVAAGIINPITGPRLSLTDNFTQLFSQAKHYYALLGEQLGINLSQELKQHRKIQDQAQLNYYQKHKANIGYQYTLGKQIQSPYFSCEFGSIEVLQSTVIDTKRLISEARNWFNEFEIINSTELDYRQIKSTRTGFNINQIETNHIIFCEGFQAINNPWLSGLPFKLSKGEILTIEVDQTIKHLLNWGNWLAPIGGITKLGSNYQWGDLNLNKSVEVKNQLLDSLMQNTRLQGRVTNHEVGIRPTTTQRKPFIGSLKNLKGAYCFNGFGSKGCLLIPYYAELFCEHLINNKPLSNDLTQWL